MGALALAWPITAFAQAGSGGTPPDAAAAAPTTAAPTATAPAPPPTTSTPTTTTPTTPPPATKPKPPPPRPRKVIGCRAAGASYRLAGSPHRRVVALTFDDGPWPTTPQVLSILERNHIHATFFLIGEQVRGRESILRRALADGDVLGNHTYTHANVTGGGYRQMASTQGAIRRATGYTPCLFRAPYGAVSGLAIRQARSLGMNTIEWSVDPRDWSRPGTGAIESRVLSAVRPGGIVLMHDGGGPRGETIAALPHIIATLRSRGYRFVTVPELLGLAPRYAAPA